MRGVGRRKAWFSFDTSNRRSVRRNDLESVWCCVSEGSHHLPRDRGLKELPDVFGDFFLTFSRRMDAVGLVAFFNAADAFEEEGDEGGFGFFRDFKEDGLEVVNNISVVLQKCCASILWRNLPMIP